MDTAIIVALISGAFTLLGTIITIIVALNKQSMEFDKKLAVMQAEHRTEAKMISDRLEEHNHYAKLYAENMPAVKQHLSDIDRQLQELKH